MAAYSQADVERAKAETYRQAYAESYAESVENGTAQGSTAERERLSAILFGAEATGREAASRHIAFETALSAEQALGLLAVTPRAEPVIPGARAKNAPGGLVVDEGEERGPDPTGDFERGRAIASGLVR